MTDWKGLANMDAKQAARTATRPSRLDAIHIAGLWSLAVAQPVFDILRGSPEFFVAHDTGPGGLLALVLVVCLAGPVGCLLALSLAGRFAPRWRRRAAVVVIGGLVAAITLAAIRQLADWSSVPSLATAAACGTFAIIGYIRLAPVRLFATFLAPAAVVVPTVFLLHPAIAGLLSPSDRQGPLDGVTFVSTPPVVVVIFDQLPLPSLLDRASRIDRALYPNFAALADGATWFRNASTVSGYTSFALPAILTGAYPEPGSLPVAADHPANLFTLLGGRYRLHVQEPLTELCPETLCQPARAGPAGWLAGVLSDLAVVYLTVVLPEDLAAPLPPVTQGWRDFAARDTFLHRWLAPRPGPRDTVTTFIDSLTAETAAAGSTLHFMHVLLPHHPWLYLPTGQRFTTHRGDIGLQNGRWVDDKWAGALRYQRHLLQVQYVDTVVGALVARLRQVGMYDDALLVVTADHGTSLRPGFPFLQPTEASFVDFAAVPLFIKRPGQRRGEVIDANIETIDILPTLAAELGRPAAVDDRRIERARPGRDQPSREEAVRRRVAPLAGSAGRSWPRRHGARLPQTRDLRNWKPHGPARPGRPRRSDRAAGRRLPGAESHGHRGGHRRPGIAERRRPRWGLPPGAHHRHGRRAGGRAAAAPGHHARRGGRGDHATVPVSRLRGATTHGRRSSIPACCSLAQTPLGCSPFASARTGPLCWQRRTPPPTRGRRSIWSGRRLPSCGTVTAAGFHATEWSEGPHVPLDYRRGADHRPDRPAGAAGGAGG